ncbi:MAG: GTP 3',8-cyclase MoaA [Thermoguttaceae bacterium]|nr:GTP 3',8-cyclase MoaA [Thermoguttaceae bacterium]MDW8036605.1 GTP 3',8-cyclase MoaA [Thermoguttaceae bacterium]
MIPRRVEGGFVLRESMPGQSLFVSAGPDRCLIDRWGRRHTDLRISVTDRCNLRCFYCMPPEGVALSAREALLDFDEIVRVVRVAVGLGIRKVRLTGGEPLLRRGLPNLVRRLASLPGLEDLAMTTNGTLLADYASTLREAGLHRINISLDTLDRRQFQALTGQDALPQVLRGIEAAQRVGFHPIKLNALAIRGWTESQVVPLVRFALERGLEIRFIEFMPICPTGQWTPQRVLPAEAILEILRQEFGSVEPIEVSDCDSGERMGQQTSGDKKIGQQTLASVGRNQEGIVPGSLGDLGSGAQPWPGGRPPAQQYVLGRTGARIGIIASVSRPFCQTCCRLRLNALGELRPCLFAPTSWDLRQVLRHTAEDEQIVQIFYAAVAQKPLCPQKLTQPPHSSLLMCQIGG